MAFADMYRGKRVLVTGHTGFKGAWLCEWLLSLGAQVTGFSLPAPTQPALSKQLGLSARVDEIIGDVRDMASVAEAVKRAQPDYVFHLAAQPLVRLSYRDPVTTYATNVMGTAHVLEALRLANRRCAVVAVTTDKCYENRENIASYREDDPLGGYDPYSSSKGAAELVIAAYRRSYFQSPDSSVKLASVRAGNVIGGGDWAEDRIVPDCIRALEKGRKISVRNKISTRPWQHVLDPLSGYLWLGARLAQNGQSPSENRSAASRELEGAYNFGPSILSNRTVLDLVTEVLKHWPGEWVDASDPDAVHEAHLLNLATDKAFHRLQWRATWNFEETVRRTIHWYKKIVENEAAARDVTRLQIADLTAEARKAELPWAL